MLETSKKIDVSLLVVSTYENIAAAKTANLLEVGKYYQFEYVTKHQIPNTDVIFTGTPENIILFATSNNTFDKRALSVDIPTDDLYYDFDDNLCEDDTTARPGFITRRKDNLTNNEVVGFDFKNAKFRRFVVDLVASNVNEWVYDDAHSKGDLVYNGTEIYVCIKNLVGNPDITETEFWLKICNTTDYICLDAAGSTKIYINETEITLKGDTTEFQDNYLFNYTNDTNINNYVKCTVAYNNTIFGEFYNNTISGNFTKNISLVDFYNNTISGDFYNNIISIGGFSNNTISQYFYNNTIFIDGFSNNTIFGNISNNTISNGEFLNNTISGDFYNNTISGDFSNNTISGDFYYNTISRDFSYNTISWYFSNNTISGYFRFNQILNNIQNIDFSLSTHVLTTYNKTIGLNSSDVLYLSYIDGDNVQQIVNITD